MPQPRTRSATPLLDEWIADEGEEGAIQVIRQMQSAIADGSLPAIDDKATLLRYWTEGLARRDV